jgi:hypothetical protein
MRFLDTQINAQHRALGDLHRVRAMAGRGMDDKIRELDTKRLVVLDEAGTRLLNALTTIRQEIGKAERLLQ